MSVTGITANTPNRLIFNAGAVYKNYGGGTQQVLGATRGGARFVVEEDMREVEIDGVRGPIKGLRRPTRIVARLEVTFLEVTQELIEKLIRTTTRTTDTIGAVDYHKYTPDQDVVDADYWQNVALVADSQTDGEPYVVKLLYPLSDAGWNINTADNDEGTIDVSFTAHFSAATATTVPYEVYIPQSAS